jgi:anti-sigma factor RsiW
VHELPSLAPLSGVVEVSRVGARFSCSETILRLDEYVDRALAPAESRLVEAHLEHCLRCAGQFRFETSLVRSIRERLRRIEVPADLMASVLRRLDSDRRPAGDLDDGQRSYKGVL